MSRIVSDKERLENLSISIAESVAKYKEADTELGKLTALCSIEHDSEELLMHVEEMNREFDEHTWEAYGEILL